MTDSAMPTRKAPTPLAHWRDYIIYIGFVAIFIIFAATLGGRGFLDPNNLLNIIRQTAIIAVVSVAMTFVLGTAEIDLSVGAVAGLASVATAMGIDHLGILGGVVCGIGTGAIVGAVNGWLTTGIGIPSFLTTLAMMGIARGVAMWISATAAIPILDKPYAAIFGGGNLGPVPSLLIWMVVFGIVGHVVLRRTTFGRRVLATGGNETSARYSGVDTASIKFRVLMLSSVAAAVAGMLYAGRLHSGRFQFGEGRRAFGDRSGRARRHEPVRRGRHSGRLHHGCAHDRAHQQRPRADGPGVQPTAHRPRRDHHYRGRD